MNAFIFDRDGVINHDSSSYIKSPAECVLIEDIDQSLQQIPKNSFYLFIASNQAGLAKKLFTSRDLAAIHHKIFTTLKKSGVFIEGIFFCPHDNKDKCTCRKPESGLLIDIFARYPNLKHPIPFIGDSERDLIAAQKASCIPVLVLTGNGQKTSFNQNLPSNTLVIDNLLKGIKTVLTQCFII